MYGELGKENKKEDLEQQLLKNLKKFQDDFKTLRSFPPKQDTYAS